MAASGQDPAFETIALEGLIEPWRGSSSSTSRSIAQSSGISWRAEQPRRMAASCSLRWSGSGMSREVRIEPGFTALSVFQ